MAIKDETSQGNKQDNNVGQQPQQQNIGGWSFHSGSLASAPINRGVGSEVYSKIKNGLIELYKQANPNVEIAIIDLDNDNEQALVFSNIIVAMRNKDQPSRGVAYHTLIIEATGDKIAPIYDNINGQQCEILRFTSNAFDDILIKKADEKIRKAFPNGPWYMADATVVPSNFNPADEHAMHKLALNAGLACGTELDIHSKEFHDLNLANMQNDSSLVINIGFNRQQLDDVVGSPMRSDVLVNFASRKKQQQGKFGSVNSGDKEVKISQVSSFIDLVWNPVQPVGGINYYNQMQQMNPQKYVARMVITDLTSSYSYTPGSVLLALTTALSLRDDNNWIQAFRSFPGSANEIDLNDIGAINIEANLANEPSGFGTRIDTKSETFKLEDLGKLIASTIQPGLIISLDCPNIGPQSWYLSVFAAAANGSNAAIRIIVDAANELTNGRFSQHFPMNANMFTDLGNRVHLGTWVDKNGTKRDIRDIDHLAVCNLVGERNPQMIRAWSDTFLRTNIPFPLRFAERRKIISGLTNETATFTGDAERVTFTAAFMDALMLGIKETQLSVTVNTPLTGSDFNNARGIGTFANAALLAPGQSFMTVGGFNYNPAQYQNGNYGNYRY